MTRRAGNVPEVIGLGALNIDYIASASSLSERQAERVTESNARFEWNVEGSVDEETIPTVINQLGTSSLAASLGGSAWNTILALGQMKVGVSLGYVGVVGRVEAPGLSFTRQMDLLHIDHAWVKKYPGRPCGLCLSYIDDTDRVMLTHPGVNFEMAAYLRDNLDGIARYLSGAQYVHVTSFLDGETPGEVLRVLTRAKEFNARLRISFDPGHDWAVHPSPAVEGILRLTDHLFVNYREFKALGHYSHGEVDASVAKKLLARCRKQCMVYVAKRYDLVEAFQLNGDHLIGQKFLHQGASKDDEMEDATGAGDVFSAAVLAALKSRRLQVELGACLGLSLARHKIRHRAFAGHVAFPDLTRGFLQSTEVFIGPGVLPTSVLIAHGGDSRWVEVRDFVEQDCGVRTQGLATADLQGPAVAADMRQYLGKSGFAVCILAFSGDESVSGRADQRLVYLAGLFQGKYGFGRVAILVEEGYPVFSNISGLIRLDFPSGQIDATFLQLERMLYREGLISGKSHRHG
ncbi:MAG: ribokinase [Streptosporangiaceae bacterium]|nr:ribokinase [Streptosporangiaceae bacterium]